MSILLSIIVLMLISSMIVAAIVIINPDIANFNRKFATREAITLEEALLGELSARNFDFSWLPAENGFNEDQLLYEESKNLYLVTLPHSSGPTLERGAPPTPTNSGPTVRPNFQPNVTTLISNSSLLSSIKYQGYKLSPSKRYLLIWTSRRKQFRHSFTAKYFIYDIKLDLISLLSTRQSLQHPSASGDSSSVGSYNQYEQLDLASFYLNDQFRDYTPINDELARFQLVDWFSPNSGQQQQREQMNNVDSLILLQNNDIYVLNNVADLSTSAEQQKHWNVKKAPIQLTYTGKLNEQFNGVPDWLYEEEILGSTPAFQVSPNGRRLAYMSFNDSQVTLMPYTVYGDQVIPRVQRIRYPKAGQPNPRVTVHVIENLISPLPPRDIQLTLPQDLASQQHYIYRINWLSSDKLALIWANRNQNNSYVLICSPNTAVGGVGAGSSLDIDSGKTKWVCEKNLHTQSNDGWLDIGDDIFPLDEEHYLALVPKFEGPDVGKFKHLVKVPLRQPSQFVHLTSGRKDVLEINGVDYKRSLVYYTSTVVGEPGQRQLFAVGLSPSSPASSATGGSGNHPARINQQPQQDKQLLEDKMELSPLKVSNSKAAAQASQGAPITEDRAASNQDTSVCVTCEHYPVECLYNFAKMSPSARYYIFQCDGPDVPRVELRSTSRASSAPALLSAAPARSRQTAKPTTTTPNHTNGHSAGLESSPPPRLITDAAHLKTAASLEPLASSGAKANANGPQNGAKTAADPSLLWTIEDNRELRDKLQYGKAMPVTVRLRVPIANTSYQAEVLLLLPPQLGSTGTFQKASPMGGGTASDRQARTSESRSRRSAKAAGANSADPSDSNQNKPLHSHYTLETIKDYVDQLPTGQQYPMVVDVYGGPASQKVDYRFHVYFGHYFATSRRTIYAMIDGRGSGYQGTRRLYELYHKLGTVEIQDQIDVVQYLTNTFAFIDSSKVAIWGWSYGGYASAMALAQSNLRSLQSLQNYVKSLEVGDKTKSQNQSNNEPQILRPHARSTTIGTLTNALRMRSLPPMQNSIGLSKAPPPVPSLRGVFECAASVAPVTNWILYDTAYTERYMGSPWTNDLYDELAPGDNAQQANPVTSLKSTINQDSMAYNEWTPLKETLSHGSSGESFSLETPKASDGGHKSPAPNLIDPIAARHVDVPQQNNHSSHATITTRIAAQQQYSSSSNTPNTATRNSIFNLNDRYRRSSLLEHIANINRKRFLLIHGTADDNVHLQQSIMLMKRLIQKNILFETRLYPDQDHGIANKADKLHLGSTLSNFFAECFDVAS